MLDEKIISQFLFQLSRMADSLDILARASNPEPNYTKDISEYRNFDWSSIGATVVKEDRDGPTHVEWGGALWLRRSPSNKFGPAIWFSRAIGKDADGNNNYLKLITFKQISDVDPVSEKARQVTGNAPVRKPDAKQPDPEKATVSEAMPVATQNGNDAEAHFAIRPKGPKDYTTYYGVTVPAFVDQDGQLISRVQAADILKSQGEDALRAFAVLEKEFVKK